MDVETGDGSLPIACTLGPADGAQRLDAWRRLGEAAGLGHDAAPGRVTLRFRDEPGVGEQLGDLVEAERVCCAFLGWELVHDRGEWRVVISGSDSELQALPLGS